MDNESVNIRVMVDLKVRQEDATDKVFLEGLATEFRDFDLDSMTPVHSVHSVAVFVPTVEYKQAVTVSEKTEESAE